MADGAEANLRDPAAAARPLGVGQRLSRVREVLEFAVHKARQLRLTEVAASLTFSSVLALVPLAAVILAILTAFPIFAEFRETLERELPKGLLPAPYAQTILRYLTEFAAKAAGVGVAGLVFVGLSALSMILTVDRVLNDIWQVHRRRSLAQRLLVYWAVLSVGPLLLGLSLSLTSLVTSLSPARVEHWGIGLRHVFALLSPALAALAYSVVYALVPNRRVAWRHALTGGIATALTGELMSRGFAAYVLHGSLASIYGAFAVVPVFLIWIFLSWLTFLFGAAIAATLPQLGRTRFADLRRAGDRAVTALALLKLLFDARSGAALGALSLASMAGTLRTDEETLAEMLTQLEDLGYVRRLAAPVGAGAGGASIGRMNGAASGRAGRRIGGATSGATSGAISGAISGATSGAAAGVVGEASREEVSEAMSVAMSAAMSETTSAAAAGATNGALSVAAADPTSGEWVLSCDPQVKGLDSAFHFFALDPGNSLLQHKDLGLSAWLAPLLDGPWLQSGLARAGAAPVVPAAPSAAPPPRPN